MSANDPERTFRATAARHIQFRPGFYVYTGTMPRLGCRGGMRRREVITLLGATTAFWPFVARAQQPPKLRTIGFLGPNTAALDGPRVSALVQRFGWIEGRTIAIEYRWADGGIVCNDPLVTTNRIRINTLALGMRLPTMYNVREFVEAGGLMSYGPNFLDLYRRAADFVDKTLRGAKPADIPVEQPTKYDLVVSLKTAKALGLTIPEAFLLRVDELIE